MEMSDDSQVRTVVRSVLEAELAPARVIDVELQRDRDHDGDPILKIRVFVEIPDQGLEPSKVRGLIRHLRKPLNDFEDVGFPIISLMSPEERSPEAA